MVQQGCWFTFLSILLVGQLQAWSQEVPASRSSVDAPTVELGVGEHRTAPAQQAQGADEQRASLAVEPVPSIRQVALVPLALNGGSTLTLVSPTRWSTLVDQLSDVLTQTHEGLSGTFGDIPAFATSLRLMDQEAFFQLTGAPAWTNAMFFRGEIIIPLSLTEPNDELSIVRAVRHEFTHAAIHSLSGGKAPGWIDEGIAQWAEGSENPALRPALRAWLRESPPVPLSLLRGGFTRLEEPMVAPAYAQSLVAARLLLEQFGVTAIRLYFDDLRTGVAPGRAFQRRFGISESQFEARLAQHLSKWMRDS